MFASCRGFATEELTIRIRPKWIFLLILTWSLPSSGPAQMCPVSHKILRQSLCPLRPGIVGFFFLSSSGRLISFCSASWRIITFADPDDRIMALRYKEMDCFNINIKKILLTATLCVNVSFPRSYICMTVWVKRAVLSAFQPIYDITLDSDTFYNEGHIWDFSSSVAQ